ncbi:hypothetical protein ACH4NO_30285 [Streptomyces olivaceus]|uniref:hypothetical protein n=1 Tax=Streptomyces olivaceus TaxID=47716 RepID=UPI0022EE0A18|nr:hypothetical protein [Streptomyces olivaceus]GHJ00778.1 hypothetical protein TPA0906_26430 [Streptomyces olivaceus]
MNTQWTARARRTAVAVAVAVGLTVGAVGCSGGDGEDGKAESSATGSTGTGTGSDTSPQEGTSKTLAEVKGQDGLLLKITSASRDAGGFVTVSGELKNDGAESVRVSSRVSGDETEVVRHGTSLGGATLVDSTGKKRYYVLRDTEGRPLTTTNMPKIKPGASVPVFMQFPSPPASTEEVSFQLPTFASATISISG